MTKQAALHTVIVDVVVLGAHEADTFTAIFPPELDEYNFIMVAANLTHSGTRAVRMVGVDKLMPISSIYTLAHNNSAKKLLKLVNSGSRSPEDSR